MCKVKHKLLSLFLALTMLVSVVPLGGIKVSAGVNTTLNWGNYTSNYAGGDGQKGTPYQISNGSQLAFLAHQVNGGLAGGKGTFYVLTSDINLSDYDWTPIGNGGPTFSGSFDGAGHKITGLKIGTKDIPSAAFLNLGLFGSVNTGSIIKNVGVDVAIYSASTSANSAGIAGASSGSITNCYVTGIVESTGANCFAGGFIGVSNGSITNCYTKATVVGDGSGSKVGGFIGYSLGIVTNCYATGNVTAGNSSNVGGFSGYNISILTNCYATGSVTEIDGKYDNVGGFIGRNDRWISTTQSYWNSDNTTIGSGTSNTTSTVGSIAPMSTCEMESATFAATLTSNRTDTANQTSWKHVSSKNQGFPVLLNVGDGIPEAASNLDALVAPGSAVETTKVTATADSGNSFAVLVSTATIATPNVGDSLPTGSAVYASGSDINSISAGKYLGVYEVDSSNTIVKFKLITIASVDIKAANIPVVTPTVTPATKVNITPQVVQSAGSTLVTVNKSDIKKDETNVIAPAVTGDTTTVETRVDIASIIGGIGNLEFKSSNSDVVLPIGAVDFTGAGAGSYLSVKQIVSKEDALVKTIIGVSKVFEFAAATYDKDGNKIKDINEFLANNKVKITINLSATDIKGLDTSKFAAFYYNETTKVYENIGGTYDSASMTFSFETTYFNKYVLGQANTSGTILPKTGSMIDINLMVVLGLIMMALGSILVLRKKRTSK